MPSGPESSSSPETVVSTQESNSVSPNKKCSSIHSNLDRRAGYWVRGTQRHWRTYSRALVRSSYTVSYKCQIRAFGHHLGTRIKAGSIWKFRCSVHRQQISLLCCKKSRLKSLRGSATSFKEDTDSARKKETLCSPSTLEGGDQRDSGCSVSRQASFVYEMSMISALI